MEILKKSLLAVILFGIQLINAQDQKTIQDAFSRSYVLETAKKYNEAAEALKNMKLTDNYPVQLRLGWLYYTGKRYEESVAAYKKAADLMPAAVEPLNGLVNPLSAQNKWVDVEQVYLSILKLDPKNSSVNYKLGLIYYNRKEYSKAEKYFSTTLNLYPFDYDAMLMSAWNYCFLGKTGEAKELFHRVLLNNPTDTSSKEGLVLIK
jgi:tetratricopeptide (TPR) repeat protein